MPNAPMKHCPKPGHPPFSASRCPACRAEWKAKQPPDPRPSARQRGYDKDWQALRAIFLARNPICAAPGCDRPATDVDHVQSVREAPHRRLDPTNLRPLCHQHHSQRTGRDHATGFLNPRSGRG